MGADSRSAPRSPSPRAAAPLLHGLALLWLCTGCYDQALVRPAVLQKITGPGAPAQGERLAHWPDEVTLDATTELMVRDRHNRCSPWLPAGRSRWAPRRCF